MSTILERPAEQTLPRHSPVLQPAHRLFPVGLCVLALAGIAVLASRPAGTGMLFTGASVVLIAVVELTRRLRGQLAMAQALELQRRDLVSQGRTTAEELEVATRMMRARAQTMTSVIDAVTEQSIIGTDRDGLIRVWNPGAERMLGLPRADVVRARSITDFHAPEELDARADPESDGHAAARFAALVQVARDQGSDVRDWTYLTADGRRLTVAVAITLRTDDDGEQAGWNFVGTDMTEARAAERLKDQFVSLISHELRTPLSSILGYLELVMDDEEQPLTADQRQYLGTVERNAQRLLRLVGDLLFTAQVDAGRFTLQPADVDLVAVVRAAEDTARVTADARGVSVRVAAPDGELVVRGDALRLGQACDNLVSNAVKFTPAGGSVTLRLRDGWQDDAGTVTELPRAGTRRVALVSVSDTGMGIPTGEQGKLFTSFFRASTARRHAVPGVGLGLTITKAITTAHGGSLDVVSAEGAGTTFTITLPAG
ncbi:PAS domain S-box-containing protein [Modestobacter sp. DSM 44400]|uniref:sensor histidine kinase n=1 Tax=Modestobacter sp. DSM 44400 TaxID=1550230 RepID=UPI0008975381|nr:ATP-binding protein [Modestobacter sp. DSM 44400]SDY52738.1 PAS domain S-box-containing protein [Modestobacter sp. DSM 44400]